MKEILNDILSDRRKKVLLDTDTYNEVDDQFALAYAMLSPDKIDLLSVNAAPFLNSRSTSPEDGMLKSYDEIHKIMELTKPDNGIPYYMGSRKFMSDRNTPIESPAAENIINTVMNSSEKVYVVAVGAITNVASAILMKPEIVNNMAIVWLGGNSHISSSALEFNMKQDIPAGQIIFDSKVPFVQAPCSGVVDMLATTVPELNYYLRSKNELCDYLVDIVESYERSPYAWSKVIWDVAAIACLVLPNCMERVIIPTPILTNDGHYAYDSARHHMIYIRRIKRDVIFGDLFKKLGGKQ